MKYFKSIKPKCPVGGGYWAAPKPHCTSTAYYDTYTNTVCVQVGLRVSTNDKNNDI